MLNGSMIAGWRETRPAVGFYWGVARVTEPGSYLTLEVRDRYRTVISASLASHVAVTAPAEKPDATP